LRVFQALADAVSSLGDAPAMAARVLDAILAALAVERGVIALAEPGGAPRILAERGGAVVLARSLIEAIVGRGELAMVRDGDQPATLVAQGVRAAMGAPLRAGDRVLGLVYVDDRRRERPFSDADAEFLGVLGRLGAVAFAGDARLRRADQLAALAAEV